jgi:hypothetical protein
MCGCLVSGAAHAERAFWYDTEISTLYWRDTSNRDSSATTFSFSAEHYLYDVHTRSHPYAEAAFLEHISSVFFNASASDIDEDGLGGNQLGFDVGVRYAFGALPFVALAHGGGSTLEAGGSDARLGTSVGGFGFGAYVTAETFIGIEWSRTHQRLSARGYGTIDENAINEIGIDAKSVIRAGADTAVAVTAGWTRATPSDDADDEVTTVDLGLQYYPKQELSVGIGAINEETRGGGNAESRFGLLQWFFSPELALNLAYGQGSRDDSLVYGNYRQKTVMIGVTGRI